MDACRTARLLRVRAVSPFRLIQGGAMTEEVLTMSLKELNRLEVVQRVVSKRLRRKEAACQLALGVRRIKRLVHRYREQGLAGLVHA